MKLDEVKSLILQNGLTDELLTQFIRSLQRVHSNYNRCQHCYTFGVELKDTDPHGGIRLIKLGLENYAQTDHDRYRSWYNLGLLQESMKDHTAAKESYLLAVAADPRNQNLYLDLLRNELHLTGFRHSTDAEHFGMEAVKMEAFARQMHHAQFYLFLGMAVLCIHRKDAQGLRAAAERLAAPALRMCATPEALQFVQSLKL